MMTESQNHPQCGIKLAAQKFVTTLKRAIFVKAARFVFANNGGVLKFLAP
jgi:hypothetical protein